jgi:hypothetical protein
MSVPAWHPEASPDHRWPDPATVAGSLPDDAGLPWRGWVLFVVGVLALITLANVVADSPNGHLITYSVTSTDPAATAFVSYRSVDGDQHGELALPWSTTVAVATLPIIYVHADRNTRSVTCTIRADNLTLVTNTSDGGGSTTTCAANHDPPSPTHLTHQHRPSRSLNPSHPGTSTPSRKPLVNLTKRA